MGNLSRVLLVARARINARTRNGIHRADELRDISKIFYNEID